MSAATGRTTNRNWDVWTEGDEPVAWSFDPQDGGVQGPLELASFNGASLQLTLAGGQTALLVRDGTLRRAYFEGVHLLRVGDESGCSAPPRSSLIMVETGSILTCRWGETIPLRAPGVRAGEAPRGDAAFRILDPARFYDAFLRHAETVGEPFIRRLLGTLLQARLEDVLATAAAAGAPEEPRRQLAALTPGDLAAGWDELGVVCVAFACDRPGVERARASDAVPVPAGHNSPPRV